MTLSPDFIEKALVVVAVGFAVALVLRSLHRFSPVRRVRRSLLLALFFGGAYIVVRGSGIANEESVRKVLLALTWVVGANTVLQLFNMLVWDKLLAERHKVEVPRLLVDLFNAVVLIAVSLLVLQQVFAFKLSGVLVGSTVVSAIIGFALQDILRSVIAGVALQVERPFAVGDWVLAGQQEGFVTQMNWRTLTIRTRDHHEIIVPNSEVAQREIVNYSHPTSLQRLHAFVGVAYRHPPSEVKAALARAAAGAEGVIADPPVEVIVLRFGDSSIDYDVRFWIVDYARAPVITDGVNTRIWYELHRANFVIAFPQRDVYMRTITEEHDARARETVRREIFDALRPLALFAPLNDAQIQTLVDGASLRLYTAGETLVEQGEQGDSLFVIRRGSVKVDVRTSNGHATTVATLRAGQFFGEMSLLTGEPRTASVIAENETEVVVVEKRVFAPVLTADCTILDGLSEALEARARNTMEQLTAANAAAAAASRPIEQRAALLSRIRWFFGVND